MSDTTSPVAQPAPAPAPRPAEAKIDRILLYSYPKVVFLYPLLIVSLAAAFILSFMSEPLNHESTTVAVVNVVFLGVLAINLVILGFDFPRATSLTLFFLAVAVVMGAILLFTFQPNLLPALTHWLASFRPLANPTFYWTFAVILSLILLVSVFLIRFDYWEVRPNELLHHHGLLANLERFPAPNLRIEKEINDVFEYVLLHSGRLILQISGERKAVILDNIPFIKKKEDAITRMLSALHVQVRTEEVVQHE